MTDLEKMIFARRAIDRMIDTEMAVLAMAGNCIRTPRDDDHERLRAFVLSLYSPAAR
jgi:hypothetical protein